MIRGEDFQTVASSKRGRDLSEFQRSRPLFASEAGWRSAVSRAYYAAFHVARSVLSDWGFQIPRGDQAHAYLWLRLSNCGDPQVQRTGIELNKLRSERNRADYDIEKTVSLAYAQTHIQRARQVIQLLANAARQPTRTQIIDAIKIYERDVLKQATWGP